MERKNYNKVENLPGVERWRFVSSGSIYAGEQLSANQVLIGGSIWDRRNTPFNDVTRNSRGVITLLDLEERNIVKQRSETLPSMVNAIIPLNSGIFIGCKSGKGAFNLFNTNLELYNSVDDDCGEGVYNAFYNENTESILVVTRKGWLESLDPETLSVQKAKKLNGDSSRLWSLVVRDDGLIVSGDYSGRIFITDEDFAHTQVFNYLDYIDDSLPESQKQWQPSVFGITTNTCGQILASVRWGQITWFDYDGEILKADKSLVLDQEITQLVSLPGSDNLLAGTRSGRLISIKDEKPNTILEIPPAYQSDNSIWSISVQDNDVIVCFSDGQVVNLNIKSLNGGDS